MEHWQGTDVCLSIDNIWFSFLRHLAAEFAYGLFSNGKNVDNSEIAITVICSSNDATLRKKSGSNSQNAKLCFLIVIFTKLLQSEFYSQNTLLHNLLITQPIHTNSNSIDAAGQVQYNTMLKKSKFLFMGGILREFCRTEFLSRKS
jgi:hypothetical protein